MYITGYAPFGDRGILIRVETDIRRGIPGVDISGLADGAVKESRERVRAAFRNSGLAFPLDRILINLAPAGVKKEGAALDLPIALSVMAAAGLIPGLAALPEQLMVLGELELSGRVRPVRGVLAAAAAGIAEGIRFFIVPKDNEEEAAILLDRAGTHYAAVSSLDGAAYALILLTTEGKFPLPFHAHLANKEALPNPGFTCGDFAEVRGQGRYKRALEIAAAGGHNLLVFGAPGAGKTMLARRLPSIMAPLTPEEAIEVTRIHSLAEKLEDRDFSLITRPPFRAPHHSASAEGILGGGRTIRPGEISLAHLGALFLDEAPEFKTNVLQALREPLEDRFLTIVRVEGPVRLPADFQLIMAANACPCGRLASAGDVPDELDSPEPLGLSDPENTYNAGCFCSPEEIHRYWRKFGGALLDRIDIRVPVRGNSEALYETTGVQPETSAVIQRRVIRAVELQRRRFGAGESGKSGNGQAGPPSLSLMPGILCRRNARMSPAQIDRYCPLSNAADRAFRKALERLSFSGRAYHSILKTARTIADLEGKKIIDTEHILEAIQHRRLGDDPYDVFQE
jgi:magnesium chelatase family protein